MQDAKLSGCISDCRVMEYGTNGPLNYQLTDEWTWVRGPIEPVSPMHY